MILRFVRATNWQNIALKRWITQLYERKIKYILENDPSDLEMTFTEEIFEDGQPIGEVELKPSGKNIAVTEANRYEYLHLLAYV